MKKVSLIAAAVLLVTSAAIGIAGSFAKFGHDKYGWKMDDAILSSLDLTPEQTEEISILRESLDQEIAPLRTQKFERWAELRLLWRQDNPDVDEVKAKQREIFDLKWQIIEKITDFRLAFRSLLTQEQLSKFISLEADRGYNRHHSRK